MTPGYDPPHPAAPGAPPRRGPDLSTDPDRPGPPLPRDGSDPRRAGLFDSADTGRIPPRDSGR